MTLTIEHLRGRVAQTAGRIEAARMRGGLGQHVRLLAATKYVTSADMAVLESAGVSLVGENRADELEEKWRTYGDAFEFHFIGHLQRRKVRQVLPCARLIHSVESLSLVREIEARAEAPVEVLLEVNLSGESTKYGILPADAEAFLEQVAAYETVRFVGLMTMAPMVRDAEDARPLFRGLRELRDQLASRFAPRHPLTELSMGMSNDYEVAVEEGATLVRLGSTLFSCARGG